VPITAKMVAVPSAHFHILLTQLFEFVSPFVDKGKAKNLLKRPSAKGAQKFSKN
jgi:hypothetical protein